MKKKILYYLKEIIVFSIVLFLISNIVSFYKSSNINKKPFNLTDIHLINSSDYEINSTKPLLVHIWATWCPTCKLEASNIQLLSEHYNVLTIAVKSGSNKDIQSWMKKNSYNFYTINDTNGLVASSFNVSVFPTTLIYNNNKKLIFSDVGYTSTWGLFLRMWWASI